MNMVRCINKFTGYAEDDETEPEGFGWEAPGFGGEPEGSGWKLPDLRFGTEGLGLEAEGFAEPDPEVGAADVDPGIELRSASDTGVWPPLTGNSGRRLPFPPKDWPLPFTRESP